MVSFQHHGRYARQGSVLIISMIFVMVFSALAVALSAISNGNVQVANNFHKGNTAFTAAQSGLECARYIAQSASDSGIFDSTCYATISTSEADNVWADLQTHIQGLNLDGRGCTSGRLASGDGDYLRIASLDLGATGGTWDIEFRRMDTDICTLTIVCTGNSGQDDPISRKVGMSMEMTKDSEVLNFAVASRGRMWLTGDTTIHGSIYSSWDRADISPFNMTNDSRIEGTANTILGLNQIESAGAFQLETLTGDNTPMFAYGQSVYDNAGDPISGSYGTVDENNYMVDLSGNPVFDSEGNRIVPDYSNRYYSTDDELLGYHEGIGYGVNAGEGEMPGMDISHYNTDSYNQGLANIAVSSTRVVEYFPHKSGNYNYPRDGTPTTTWNYKMNRNVYNGQTFANARLPDNNHALFKNCTFEGVLYVDCYKSASTYYNNVRFEDCTFNGVIVTDTPQSLVWYKNTLYFTGAATFNNTSSIKEVTILAPQFNVNLGNTNPESSDNNVLTGAIVGGIVDVRGNAQIYGTIISMCDTTDWSSGYVTNIGATLDDGGSETTELGDVGVIEITPEEHNQLPSGITTPIVIAPILNSYTECI